MVGGEEFVPVHGAGFVFDAAADVLFGLPDGEGGALGVLAHCHAAGVEDVHGAEDGGAAVLGDGG